MAAHNNWDGFLGSAVFLQKQKYASPEIESCLEVAIVIAFLKIGSLDKARKAAAKLFGPGRYFAFLDAEKIWSLLMKDVPVAQNAVVAPSSSSSSSKAPKKKKKGKSKTTAGSQAAPQPANLPASSSSSSTSLLASTHPSTAAQNLKEPEVQYEPHTKPSQVPVAVPTSSNAPEPSSSVAAAPPSVPKAQYDSSVDSAPAGLVYAACPICYDRFPDCTIIPCGHTFCLRCSKNLKLCSICRQPIEKWHRFFLSQGEPDMAE
jgi:hypothetical protein